jgi:glycosyltransferase involved in cell wall biosynthesis
MNPETTPVIAAVGEVIDRPKSPELALEPVRLMAAALRACEADAGAKLLDQVGLLSLIGLVSWPYRDPVRQLAAELGIAQRVRFLGALPDAALEAEYARADLFALATRYEGYGMAAAEAMARGLPMAITAGGAIAEIVPEDAAVVAAVDDHNALSRAMRRPIFDTALRADMAEASRRAGQALPRWPDRAAAFLKALDHV